jgi:G3E family GTPase
MHDAFVNQAHLKASLLLLAGFLGAGKTTLLRRIISWEADLAETVVLVNEFGDIGIDGALLKDSGSDVIELTSGCICCTLSADLRQSLTNIWNRFKPRRILIESSGVADPYALTSILNQRDISQWMHLDKIITVLDADFWEAREAFGPLFYNQLKEAHLILLNKIDLVEKNKIAQFLKEIHEVIPDTQVIPTIHCAIDPETLWMETNVKAFGIKPIHFYKPLSPKIHPQASHHHLTEQDSDENNHPDHHGPVEATNYVTFSFQNSQIIDEHRFKAFIHQLPWEVFRIKGPIRFEDRVAMLNFVGGKSDWSTWEGEAETRLAFIGWGIRPEEILPKLKNCIAES